MMFSDYSIGSTIMPGTSSGGPLPRSFALPSGRATISRTELAPALPGQPNRHRYEVTFTQEAVPAGEMMSRVVASFMVFSMPATGLDETLTTLWDIFDFYRSRPTAPSLPAVSTMYPVITGKAVGGIERHPFPASE